jgi:hypothetical protein
MADTRVRMVHPARDTIGHFAARPMAIALGS